MRGACSFLEWKMATEQRTRAERLPPEIFDLPVEMREGYCTDAYFNHTRATSSATAATRAS